MNQIRTTREESQEFHRLMISRGDFEDCLRYLKYRKTFRYASVAGEALISSALICYARPFSNNERGSKEASSRVPNWILNPLSASEELLHRKLIDVRNKAVAHAEWASFPVRIRKSGVVAFKRFSLLTAFTGPVIRQFEALAWKLHDRANNLVASHVSATRIGKV